MNESPFISVITPVYNGGYPFVCCLLAISQTQFSDWELIVVDDGSTDESAPVARKFGAKVLQTGGRKGPGAARNIGATAAKGEYLCFVDADCEVCGDAIAELAQLLGSKPEIDALFGSYDDAPKAINFVAQYKNLMHHYVHQQGKEDASTFWAGFGVVKRSLFLSLGGFDLKRYPRPSIEDIELGYRLKEAGANIYLAKNLQVKHHKAWKLFGLIKTDVFDRGIPWTKLLINNESNVINDLNLQTSSRISVVATYSLISCIFASIFNLATLIPGSMLAVLLLYLNWDVYRFFYHKRGIIFAVKVIPMHLLYYFYAGLSFVLGTVAYWQARWFGRETTVTTSMLPSSNQ
ncbi:glycosyltransferase family 2 protein [Pleurocapsales cyanobacterium LEGE 10410]|nr:glycosyltransferase family 2 protein [Pleurocapsales cyanobacterium LEGE 10410]